MPGLTDVAAKAFLDSLPGTYPYAALFIATGADTGAGFTEADFGGYARVNVSELWNAAAGSSPPSKTNSGVISFPNSTTNGSLVIGWGLFSAPTGGVLGFSDYLGIFSWMPATFDTASPAVLELPGHSFSNGDTVVATTKFGSEGTIAAGWTAGLLTVANVTTDTFTAGVNAANTGGLMLRKVAAQAVVSNMQIQLPAGSLKISFG